MGKRIMLRRATSVPRLVGDRLVITEHSSGEPLKTPRHLNSVVSRPQLHEQTVVLQVDRQAPGRLRPPQLFTPRDSLRLLQHVRFQGPLRMPQLLKFPLISQIGSNEATHGRQPVSEAGGRAVLRLHVSVQIEGPAVCTYRRSAATSIGHWSVRVTGRNPRSKRSRA